MSSSPQFASALLTACGGFLLAILWMDLIFDVQAWRSRGGDGALPEPVLSSIADYYRRATTTARPMGHLVGAVMAVLVATLLVQLVWGDEPGWLVAASLGLAGGPIVLGLARAFPNAVRLGTRADDPTRQSVLARSICHDHVVCAVGMTAFLVLRLSVAMG